MAEISLTCVFYVRNFIVRKFHKRSMKYFPIKSKNIQEVNTTTLQQLRYIQTYTIRYVHIMGDIRHNKYLSVMLLYSLLALNNVEFLYFFQHQK